jgi:Bacteriophage tail sheath protein
MPEYLPPGVYVNELPGAPRPIEGVPTSTAAFLGETERGPLTPRLVTSVVDYERWFGSAGLPDRYLPRATRGFIENGGRRLYVARVVGAGATTASRTMGGLTVRAAGPGAWGNRVWGRVLPPSAGGATAFTLRLAWWRDANPPDFDPFDPANAALTPRPQLQEEFDDVSIDPQSPNYFASRVVSPLATVSAVQGGPLSLTAPTPGQFLENGSDADDAPTAADYAGDIDAAIGRNEPQGLAALSADAFRDVALVHAPFPADDASSAIAKLMVRHCGMHRFRFAVVDSPNVDPMMLDARDAAAGIADAKYAAFYAPWLIVADPATGTHVAVPPGGHVCGIYARVDIERGVHEAPANEVVLGALDLAFAVTDEMQDALNPRGVNVIRRFPSRGIRVWGARTLSSDAEWKYVPVRRLFIFLERSISEGIQWAVFEPNDEPLWARVRDTVRLFLRAQWRSGALLGRTENEAFFIACDRSTMTSDDILNGRLVCEIGVAPVRPAEFVIFRIFQRTLEARDA